MNQKEREYHRRRKEKVKLAYAALMKCYPLTLEDLDGEIWLPAPYCANYLIWVIVNS